MQTYINLNNKRIYCNVCAFALTSIQFDITEYISNSNQTTPVEDHNCASKSSRLMQRPHILPTRLCDKWKQGKSMEPCIC